MKKALSLLLVMLMWPVALGAANNVDINTASAAQLDQLVGIGPALAQRIIDGRPFSSVDELLKVKGIGEKTLQKIKDQGLATVITNAQLLIPNEAPKTIEFQKSTPAAYPMGIVINEILPGPDGPDETNEFIELYNSTDAQIDVSGWRLQDSRGTAGGYTFKQGSTIAAGGYLVLFRPETKIVLNNDQDALSLFFPNGILADAASYANAPTQKSYNKTASGWSWSISPTPGNTNKIIAAKTLSKGQKTGNKTGVGAAALSDSEIAANPFFLQPLNGRGASSWLLFVVAAIITAISGTMFLILKLRLFKKDVRS